jgi:lysophospholipase L1-like esterase
MKKIIVIFILFLLLPIVYFMSRNPVLTSDDVDEINHSLLETLDPHLGYAHNINLQSIPNPERFHFHFKDPEYQFLKNDFIKMSYEETKSPMIIGVLGASETDPFLFDGNWPLLLHNQLKEKKIPHIIYNGAVSGYNSNQIFIKFTRDLLQLAKPDYVIVYHGAADCPVNHDTVENHRDVHPRTILTLQELTKFTNQKDLNLLRQMKTFFFREKYPIQMGVEQNDYIKNYLKNMDYINIISRANKIKFAHVQILYPTNSAQTISDKDITPQEPQYISSFEKCLKDLNGKLSTTAYSFSYQGKLKADDAFFYDPMHLTPAGNKFLTEEIIKQLKLIP